MLRAPMILMRRRTTLLVIAAVLGLGALASQLASARRVARVSRPLPIGAYTTKGAWSFVSAPQLHPPRVKADAPVRARRLAHGLFLVATLPVVGGKASAIPLSGEGGPLILDSKLQPVWIMPVGTRVASADLQQQTYRGKPVLTWWQGTLDAAGATNSGEDIVVDQHYRRVATLKAAKPWVISQHDTVITPDGKAWVTVYRTVKGQNLAPYHGSRHGSVYDVGVEEYDLATGKLEYTWDALNPGGPANVPLSDSEVGVPHSASTPWDAYHINSVQPMGTGQALISLRNTWGVYLIDTVTGKPIWKLGGRRSTFSAAPDARFYFQHDARLAGNRLTMFDDACCEVTGPHTAKPPHGPSRGLILKLDVASHKATLVHQYLYRPRQIFFLGSTRVLPNGNVLVGWGSGPYFTEYSASGQVLLDALFPGSGKDINYRALFTSSWIGAPAYPPSAAVRRSRRGVTVYASWNGATQVAGWEVMGGSSPRHLKRVAQTGKAGFETAIRLRRGTYKVLQVKALDRSRHVLGSSKTLS